MFWKILYYLPILFIILYYLLRIANTKQFSVWAKMDKAESDAFDLAKLTNPDAKPDFSSGHIMRTYIGVFMLLWTFIGLFSANWWVFGGILVLAFFTTFLMRPFRTSRFQILVTSLLFLPFYVFALLNAFHLHLRLPDALNWLRELPGIIVANPL